MEANTKAALTFANALIIAIEAARGLDQFIDGTDFMARIEDGNVVFVASRDTRGPLGRGKGINPDGKLTEYTVTVSCKETLDDVEND